MKYKYIAVTMMAAVGILILAACGSDSADVASLRSTEDRQVVTSTADAGDTLLDNEAKMMAFTQCMRDHGVEMMDPVVDSDGNVQKPEFAEGAEINKKEWGPVWEACSHHLEGVTFGEKRVDVSEQIDRFVALAACLRDKGYDVDEPTAETFDQWLIDFKTMFDWKDPKAVADYEECSGKPAGKGSGK